MTDQAEIDATRELVRENWKPETGTFMGVPLEHFDAYELRCIITQIGEEMQRLRRERNHDLEVMTLRRS
jgi:hypothetical protein|tara:strand:- start:254 stop:460 length:207 start_codon:yes stop_codon:yes gene_type:complete